MLQSSAPCICRTDFATKRRCFSIIPLLLSLLGLLLGACQPNTPSAANADMAAPVGVTSAADNNTDNNTGQLSEIASTTSMTATADDVAATVELEAASSAVTVLPPIRLAIPALNFAAEIEPMAWQVTEVDGQRQAVWQVPEANVGWHINSAGVGAAGNMLLSGHHRQGSAIFAPLARGEVNVNDEIYVTDEAGQTYRYAVSEIAAPIPVVGATEREQAQLAAYQAPSTEGLLTLITGWPDFSDTHYLIIVAKLIDKLE